MERLQRFKYERDEATTLDDLEATIREMRASGVPGQARVRVTGRGWRGLRWVEACWIREAAVVEDRPYDQHFDPASGLPATMPHAVGREPGFKYHG
jgi:hypothetical protein